jgi:hypothetical protein
VSINIAWDNDEHTIMRMDFAGLWTWEDYCRAINRILECIQDEEGRIGLIAHFQADTMVPTGLIGRNCEERTCMNIYGPVVSQQIAAVVVIGRNPRVDIMLSGFCRAYQQMKLVLSETASLDEARALLREQINGNHAQSG